MTRIGICLGTGSNPIGTVENQILAWGEYLQNHDLEAYGDAGLPQSASDYYTEIEIKSKFSKLPYPVDSIVDVYQMTNRYIKRRSPDVVIQLWKFNTHGPGATLAAQQNGVPVIARFTGDVFNEYNIYSGVERYIIYCINNGLGQIPTRYADRIISFGPNGVSEISKRRGNSDEIVILPPAKPRESRFYPSKDRAEVTSSLDLRSDCPVALFVGRLSKLKGMEFLDQVIELVSNKTEMQFVLVGDGNYRNHLDKKYPNKTVKTIGKVPYQSIHDYYKASDVYIHPSQSEGIPLVILEALCCGLPVIAREAGDIGFVTPNIVETPNEMAEMILNKEWSEDWLNEQCFSDNHQKETLQKLIENTVK